MQVDTQKTPLIDRQLLNDCAVSARTVSHNLELEVMEGKKGGGSYLISGEGRFVLDPEHCKTRDEAIWTACHEGMHEWQTPGFSTLPLAESDRKKLEQTIGLAALHNVIEDCAGNDGMVRSHPGLAAPTVEIYRKQLEHVGGMLGHPEIISIAQQIGHEPRFARALASILNGWAEFRVNGEDFDLKLGAGTGFQLPASGDRDIDQVLKEALLPTSIVINQTLITGKEEKAQVRDIGVRRFFLMKEYLLPLIERLVKLDIQQELQNQTAQKAQRDGSLSEKTNQEIAQQQNQQSSPEEGQSENGAPSNQGGDASQREGKGEAGENASAIGEKGSGRASSKAGQSQGASGSPGSGTSGDPAPKGKSGQGAIENDPAPDKHPSSNSGLADQEIGAEQNTDANKPKEESKLAPIDVSKLSEEARRELDEYFYSLPAEEQDRLSELAKKLLQDLDDALASLLKPKNTADDSVPTHQQQQELQAVQDAEQQASKRFGAFSQAIRDASLRAAEPYQRIYMDVAPYLDRVEEQVRHLFIPEDDLQWRGAFPSGQKLNKQGPMRFEADPSQYVHLFDRRNQPSSFSYEFDLIVDRSGSMAADDKFEETKRVAVFLVELLARFDIPCSVRVFDNAVKTVKKWDDDAKDPLVQKVIAESFLPQGGTNDALAIAAAYREATEREEKNKFILVLSDAESGVGASLKAILKKIRSEGQLVLFHFGIGPNTTDLNGFYPHSRGDLPVKGDGGFFTVFTEVLGDLILNPHLYKGKKNETRE